MSFREKSARLKPAMSGAPVFDEDGRVLGIVSGTTGSADVRLVCVALALPGWLVQTARELQIS